MSSEQDAGKAGKKMMIGLGVAAAAAAILIYVFISWGNKDNSLSQSSVSLNGTAVTSSSKTDETAQYVDLMQTQNNHMADKARQQNDTFLASMPRGVDIPVNEDTPDTEKTPEPRPRLNQEPVSGNRTSSRDRAQDRDSRENLKALLLRMRSDNSTEITIASTPGNEGKGGGGNGGGGASAYSGWTESLVSATQASLSNPSSTPVFTVIPAFTRVPAQIETAIDSDNTASQVIARVPAGKYAGATVYAASIRLVGDGVEIHFSRMAWLGQEYNVNAYALSQETLQSSVATDVNHRYVSRILLPAVLGGLGDVGSLYKSSNTQILSNQYSSVTSTEMPSGKAVAGVVAGGAAEKAASVLQQDASKLPATQVTVKRKETISLQFIDGVYNTDAIQKGQRSPTTTTSEQGSQARATSRPVTTVAKELQRQKKEYNLE